MADDNTLELTQGENNIPPLRISPVGYNGLNVTSGFVYEECDPALRWPQCQYTFKKMLKDATISSSVDMTTRLASKVPWWIEAPKGKEKDHEQYVKALSTMLLDMDQSWLATIKQILSFVHSGFSYFEVIPRQRLKSKGSKYNDGLWGIKKIALRSQDTISAVEYKNNGREFVGFWQRVNNITNKGNLSSFNTRSVTVNGSLVTEVLLKADNCLLFRNNPIKDNPFGVSPLISVFEAWRYKKAYEEAESFGVDILAPLKRNF